MVEIISSLLIFSFGVQYVTITTHFQNAMHAFYYA